MEMPPIGAVPPSHLPEGNSPVLQEFKKKIEEFQASITFMKLHTPPKADEIQAFLNETLQFASFVDKNNGELSKYFSSKGGNLGQEFSKFTLNFDNLSESVKHYPDKAVKELENSNFSRYDAITTDLIPLYNALPKSLLQNYGSTDFGAILLIFSG